MTPDQIRGVQSALDSLNSLANRAILRLTRSATAEECAVAREEIAQAMKASDALIVVLLANKEAA